MPSTFHAILCAVAATLFWTCVGFAIARRLVDRTLALPIAPALGWAVHSAATLPIVILAGFSTATLSVVCAAAVVVGLCAMFIGRAVSDTGRDTIHVPLWAYIGAALVAVGPAVAIVPKIGIDGIAFAAPIFDHSKIAMIDEMTRLGLPPGNPFFSETGEPASRLAYYYLWHFSAAELSTMTGATGWEADIALTWFTAFSSVMLMVGLAVWFGGRPSAALWVLLLSATASLRLFLCCFFDAETMEGFIAPAAGFGGWLLQGAWVPQHIASASCVVLAVLLLGQLASHPNSLLFLTFALLAAAGYESSTWIGGVIFPAAAALAGLLFLLRTPSRHRVAFVIWSATAGLLAICVVSPLLHDQFWATAARDGGAPIALQPFEVLGPSVPQWSRRILDLPAFWLVLLPIELPAIYLTGCAALWGYLRRQGCDDTKGRIAAGFALLVVASLLGSWLLVSTIGDNNDLGWRAVLPGAFVLTVFAAVGLSHWIASRAWVATTAAVTACLLALPQGIALLHGNAVGSPEPDGKAFGKTSAMWAAVRRHTTAEERIANNPLFLQRLTPWPINLSWALLSDRRSCFAGRELTLAYTSLPRSRREQINAQFIRVFAGHASREDVRELAERYDCRVVVLTPEDGAWGSDPFATSPLYRLVEGDDRWRIYRVKGTRVSATQR